MNDQTLILLCTAGAVSLLVYFAAQFVMNRGEEGKLRNRLKGGRPESRAATAAGRPKFKDLVQNIGQKAAKPFLTEDANKQFVIRRNLARAGIYTPSAIRAIAGAKLIFAGTGLVIGYLLGIYLDQLLFGLSL